MNEAVVRVTEVCQPDITVTVSFATVAATMKY